MQFFQNCQLLLKTDRIGEIKLFNHRRISKKCIIAILQSRGTQGKHINRSSRRGIRNSSKTAAYEDESTHGKIDFIIQDGLFVFKKKIVNFYQF